MESDTTSRQISLTNLLPFMNKTFISRFLEDKKHLTHVSDVRVILKDDLPNFAILAFEDKKYKEEFKNQIEGKMYDNLDYPISYVDGVISPTETNESEDFKTTKIDFSIRYENLIDTSYQRTLNDPGLIFTDKDIISKQDKVISFLIKKIGSNLIKGKSIMNVSLPVNIFDKRTLLQVLAYEMSFAPIFLSRAYNSPDKLDKLKFVTIFLISQLHLSPLQMKPFSPILGETFQCKIGDLDIYVEQTVSKPLTYNFYMVQSAGMYKIHGYMSTDASTGANSIKAKKIGRFVVEFKDRNKYEIFFPQIYLKGTTMGKRQFNFKHIAIVTDLTNELTSYIEFNPDERGAIMSIFSSKQKTFPDTFRGDIFKASDVTLDAKGHKHSKKKNAKSLCSLSGEWTKYIAINSIYYWQVRDYELIPLTKMKFTLPSDSSFREDLNYLLQNDETNSQSAKEKLEEIQRGDRKLRETFMKQK